MEIRKKLSLIIALGAVILVALFFLFEINGFYTNKEDKTLTVSKGDTFSHITEALNSENVINSKLIFKVYTKVLYRDKINSVRPGSYTFLGKQSYKEILKTLDKGPDTEKVTVTVTHPSLTWRAPGE